MTEAAVSPRYQGIFNRSTRGRSLSPTTVLIERGRIQSFAQVLGETDPIHFDVNAARARGYPDVVAPPSFFTVIDALANAEIHRFGHQSIADLIGCDYRFLLHGDERYDYTGDIFAGDEVTITSTVLDFYDKKGGTMEFATISSVLEHVDRGVLLRAARTLLHRLG